MILGIIQARTSSSRLPKKVLRPILGSPMLSRQIERVKKVTKIDKIILATSTQKEDDVLEKLALDNAIECFRGSLDNVLERYYKAANKFKAQHVVRLTGDCPVIDFSLIDTVINFFFSNQYDYACLDLNYPDGLDVEIMTMGALSKAYDEAKLPSEKEHVTAYIHNHPSTFKIGKYTSDNDYSHLRWTVDEEQDFELIEIFYKALYHKDSNFTWTDLLTLIKKNPELITHNSLYERNEGYKKSLLKDNELLRKEHNESIS